MAASLSRWSLFFCFGFGLLLVMSVVMGSDGILNVFFWWDFNFWEIN
jgi:hypothetical protein